MGLEMKIKPLNGQKIKKTKLPNVLRKHCSHYYDYGRYCYFSSYRC